MCAYPGGLVGLSARGALAAVSSSAAEQRRRQWDEEDALCEDLVAQIATLNAGLGDGQASEGRPSMEGPRTRFKADWSSDDGGGSSDDERSARKGGRGGGGRGGRASPGGSSAASLPAAVYITNPRGDDDWPVRLSGAEARLAARLFAGVEEGNVGDVCGVLSEQSGGRVAARVAAHGVALLSLTDCT